MALSEGSGYEVITSEEAFQQVLQKSEVVVVDWMAKWCRKCIYLKPKLEKLVRDEFPQLSLAFVDVNAVPVQVVTGNGIKKMPTIAVYRRGEKITQHIAAEGGTGAIQKIREMLQGCELKAGGEVQPDGEVQPVQ
ncbi:hypothetical protein WJX72_010290 [[Myrmecia] bisecta]|uniref:Thioredoxin domain-containing protein n=1 Tax=[Myrmecia] bisecta TaxID=41462 RepID=A0AAW1Q5I4_9CHLO